MSTKILSIRRAALSPRFSAYVCPSCYYHAALKVPRKCTDQFYRHLPPNRRPASTTASVTAVNARKEIPPSFQATYDALDVLQHEAAVYTSLSQVKLALRGLESENGVTRLAVLSSDDQTGARRLVRVLLADPLAPEAEWEKKLLDVDDTDGRALLLRYGPQLEVDQKHPLVRTLSVPSTVLQNHNLEILIGLAPAQQRTGEERLQDLFVPRLETSSTGVRITTVEHPVHKTIVYTPKLADISIIMSLASADATVSQRKMAVGIIDSSWTSATIDEPLQPINLINLKRGEQAISTFRKSLDNSLDYERAWFDSGLPKISSWLIEGTEALPGTLKPSIRRILDAVAGNTNRAIFLEEDEFARKQRSAVVPVAIRNALNDSITTWAESAHTELRNKLDQAFSSKSWGKLTWWKLFWRVDDVSFILSDILTRSWLVDADRGILHLSGRIEQAGLLPPYGATRDGLREKLCEDPSTRPYGTEPPLARMSDLVPASALSDPSPSLISPISVAADNGSIPSIAESRQYLLYTTVPSLQALSQRLLLHALSTTALTSTLSALTYLSFSMASVYEAGAIGALGTVYALRRLQKRWEDAREKWAEGLREEGRLTLRAAEEGWRAVVREGGTAKELGKAEQMEYEERTRAKKAVERIRVCLEEMAQ